MAGSNNATFKRLEEVFAAGRDANEDRVEVVSLLVVVDTTAHDDVVLCIKDAFMPVQNRANVEVRRVEEVAEDPDGAWDACVVVAGGNDEDVERAAVGLGRRGNPIVVVAQSVLDIPESCLVEPISAFVATIAASDAQSLRAQISSWLMRACSKQTALAASFRFCRRERVKDLARACAAQNAAIGVVNLLPGSDFPYIVVNQAKLALDIAAVYGEPFSVARLPELVGVAGAGIGYRSAARLLVRLIPVLGRVICGVTAYAGTMSTARTLSRYFARMSGEEDTDLGSMRSDVMQRVSSLKNSLPGLCGGLGRDRDDDFADYGDFVDHDEPEVRVASGSQDYIVLDGVGTSA